MPLVAAFVPARFAAIIAVSVVALALLAFGVRELAVAHRILSREPDAVFDAPGGGPIELEGTVVPEGESLRSPFTGTECVAYEYEVQEQRTRTRNNGKTTTTETYWETIASGEETIPFRLKDDTGAVLVDPAGADLRLSTERAIRVEGGAEPPDRIARYIREDDRVDDQNRSIDLRLFELSTGRDRKFVERRLDLDEQVHVLGITRYDPSASKASGHVNAVVGAPEEARSPNPWIRLRSRLFGPRFLISDTTDRGAGLRVALPGVVAILLGLGVLVFVALFVP